VAGAHNLAHYLALRRRDLRPLQEALARWGLSSLGRSEGHALATLDAVIAVLEAATDPGRPRLSSPPLSRAFARGRRALDREAALALGPAPRRRGVRIMVTLGADIAGDPGLCTALVRNGMDVARINCGHDDPDTWARMIDAVRDAAAREGRSLRVLMDLSGPRARTEAVLAPPKTRLRIGDALLLVAGPPRPSAACPVVVQSALPEIVERVRPGTAVWFDEGKLGARCVERTPEGLLLRVFSARPDGEKIAAEKGINVPGVDLGLSALGPGDLDALDFVVGHADAVGYSFVQSAADVARLQDELDRRGGGARAGRGGLPIVAKIETERALAALPEIVVRAAGRQPLAVMIARGDLAVELGFERLAEAQEEILWLCEAAHVPVVWATQVLDRLVRKGSPSRAEITDAAMSERAECVMLNKGPHLALAIHVLDDVLCRMQAHQSKKTPHLAALPW
jgi:pyruvate kinase